MKVNWQYEQYPNCVSFTAFGKKSSLVSGIKKSKEVIFLIQLHTKTSLDIQIMSGDKEIRDDLFAVAHIPQGAENFKYLKQSHCGIWDYKSTDRFYFKLTKKQGKRELCEYLFLILKELNLNMDEVTATLKISSNIELN